MALGTGGGQGWDGPELLASGRMRLHLASCSDGWRCCFPLTVGSPPPQVLLQGLSAPLANPPGALVAVARVVTNIREYE